MSDVKPHVIVNTSILDRQYTMAVTFDRFCVWMCHFEQKMYSKCHKMASY